MLTIDDLRVNINGEEVLHGVDLHIPDGEVHALFGPNGSGKSVLIMTIMGYPDYEITHGQIVINDQDVSGLAIEERAKLGVGLCEQRPPTIQGVTFRNLFDLITPQDKPGQLYVDEMRKKFRIDRFLDRDINDGLSGGEIKQAELFMVLIADPKLLILDEPDSGVDPEHLKKIGKMINESLRDRESKEMMPESCLRRNAALIATHSAAILDYIHTDKAHVMVGGKIRCTGNPGIMMDQIRDQGYAYCIKCQNDDWWVK